jgi:gliding motility-associated-like protein
LYAGQPVLPDTVQLIIAGSATNTVDYNTLANSFIFTGSGGMSATQPSDTIQYVDLWAYNDAIAEGMENIKVYVVSGCFNLPTDSIIMEIRDSLSFNLLNTNTAICLGQSVPITGTADAGIGILWTPGTSAGVLNPNIFNTVITPTTIGTQYYTVTSSYFTCPTVSKGFQIITEPQPILQPLPDLEVCEGRAIAISAFVSPPFGYNLNWSPSLGTGLINTNGYNPIFNGTSTDSITFTVTSPNANCIASDKFEVKVWPFQKGNIIDDTLLCGGSSLQLWVTGGNPALGYQWYPASTLSCEFCANPISTSSGTTVYHAILLDDHGCMDTLETNIEIHPPFSLNLRNNDTTIVLGESVQIFVDGNAPFMYWNPTNYLSFSQSNDPVATPLETTTYRVTGVSLYSGCPITDSFKITVVDPGIIVPNAFTPNGDGKNDVFRLLGGKLDNVQEFRIFNRWGQEVFSTNNIQKGWDGNYKGVTQNSGTFYYLIRVARPTGKVETLKGEFILMR